jgi:hypothetical protein
MTRVRPKEDLPSSAGKSDFNFSVQTWRCDLNGDNRSEPRSNKEGQGSRPTPTPAVTRRHAYLFLPQLVDFDLSFLSQLRSDFFNFRFKKKLVYFSLTYINCLRKIWLDCGVVVQQSLPLLCRGDFPVSRGEHVSNGLAKWPNRVGRGKTWALHPCLANLRILGSRQPPSFFSFLSVLHLSPIKTPIHRSHYPSQQLSIVPTIHRTNYPSVVVTIHRTNYPSHQLSIVPTIHRTNYPSVVVTIHRNNHAEVC